MSHTLRTESRWHVIFSGTKKKAWNYPSRSCHGVVDFQVFLLLLLRRWVLVVDRMTESSLFAPGISCIRHVGLSPQYLTKERRRTGFRVYYIIQQQHITLCWCSFPFVGLFFSDAEGFFEGEKRNGEFFFFPFGKHSTEEFELLWANCSYIWDFFLLFTFPFLFPPFKKKIILSWLLLLLLIVIAVSAQARVKRNSHPFFFQKDPPFPASSPPPTRLNGT